MYTDIKTTADALSVINADPKILEILNTIPDSGRKPIIDDYLLKSVIAAVNMMPASAGETKLETPWIPDFTDGTVKYALWPDVETDESKPSGFGLSYFDCVSTFSDTRAGSRLTFRSRNRALYVFDQFRSLVEAVYLIDK